MSPRVAVAVQASLVSWEGGRDLCANAWDGKLVVEHTLERARDGLGECDLLVVAPDSAENAPLTALAERYGAQVVFGSFHDVVERFCEIPERYTHVLRIVGMHPFFSVELARDMLAELEARPRDLYSPPERLEVQFGLHLLSLEALRRAQGADVEAPQRVSPVLFLRQLGASERVLEDRDYSRPEQREAFRSLAKHIYKEGPLNTAADAREEDVRSSQIYGHYSLAVERFSEGPLPVVPRVLDLGGGRGFGEWLRTRWSRPLSYTLVDLDWECLRDARARDPNGMTVQANGYALPFAAESFDLVLAFEIIEHVERPQALLEEALRVARPEGLVAISTPQNRSGLPPLNPGHLFELTRDEFDALCREVTPSPTYFTFHSGRNYEAGLTVGNNMFALLNKAQPA